MSDNTVQPYVSTIDTSGLIPKGAGKKKVSEPRDTTTTSVHRYTMEEAQGYAVAAFRNAIGREPSQEELATFLDSFNANQTPSVTRTHYANGSATSVTTGGTDEAMLARNLAQQNPEFSGYQKATTYFDAMLGALQGPVGGSV